MTEFSIKNSWGVASVRQCSGFPHPDDSASYYSPLECSIVKWNIFTKEKSMFQAHNDLITVMLLNKNNIILTASFSGEVKLWNKDLCLLVSFQLPTDDVIFGYWSLDGSLFSLCSRGPKQKLLVYNLETVFYDYQRHKEITYKWESTAPQKPIVSNSDGGSDAKKRKSYDCYNAAIFKENLDLAVVYQSKYTCELFLFTSNGTVIKTAEVSPLGDKENIMLSVSSVHKNIVAVGLQHGIFGFYDVNSLEQLVVISATGLPQACLWQEDKFVTVSFVSGIITWWSEDGHELKEWKGAPTGSVVQMNLSITDKNSYWIGCIMSLHYVTISQKTPEVLKSVDLSFLELTGCGLAINNNNLVASGDFTGQLLLWEYSNHFPIEKLQINTDSQVRSLEWFKEYLLIGTLDGKLSVYNAETNGSITLLYSCNGGVTIVILSNDKTRVLLGTTAGLMYIFSISADTKGELKVELLYKSLQHKPKSQTDGTSLPMEIWSAAWSVDDSMVATCSEDQTTTIAVSDSGTLLRTLNGHSTAVTSVSWKQLSNGQIILATCADDRTIRVYDGKNFSLLKILNTYDINSWHTLTYLVINEMLDLLIVSTQNGFLAVWDLKSYECLCKRKMHAGSIEGLALDINRMFVLTTSSDCVVQRFAVERK